MKKAISTIAIILLVISIQIPAFAVSATNYQAEEETIASTTLNPDCNAAYLIEANTGICLYAKEQDTRQSVASVTKIMTLLLFAEALERGAFTLSDTVRVSAYAASMGGSQVFLKEGEEISVEDLLKSAIIASANDASVAIAELVAGSERIFVENMNKRAAELGLQNTRFENVTGLDDTTVEHYSSARDVATMSRELIRHDIILKYSCIWQDSIRGGEFTLTNTNRLIRYYDGATGLKTGSTDKAGFCISATAKRDNMSLIAVVLGAETRDKRNEIARELLDFGFASYAVYHSEEKIVENVPVYSSKLESVPLYSESFSCLIDRSKISSVEIKYDIPEYVCAPITAGQVVGGIEYYLDGELIGKSNLYIKDDIPKLSALDIFFMIISRAISGKF